MSKAELAGIFSVKLPVTDLQRSLQWYQQVFDVRPIIEFPDDTDGVVRGIACEVPGLGDTGLALREDPDHARGISGFAPVNFAVRDKAAIEAWAGRLDRLGIEHSPTIDATVGWLLVFYDPDGLELHLYSRERHGLNQSDRPGYGRSAHADATA